MIGHGAGIGEELKIRRINTAFNERSDGVPLDLVGKMQVSIRHFTGVRLIGLRRRMTYLSVHIYLRTTPAHEDALSIILTFPQDVVYLEG